MLEFIKTIPTSQFAEWLDFIANTSIIVAVITWVIGRLPKKFHLESTGKTYKIWQKDFNVQTVTNEISRVEANGGTLDPKIRAEIIRITQSNHFKTCTTASDKATPSESQENTENHGSTDEKRPD